LPQVDAVTNGNMAFGVSEPTLYSDPTVILTGAWAPTQSASGVVKIESSGVRFGKYRAQLNTSKRRHQSTFRSSVTCEMGVLWNTMWFALRRFHSMHFCAYDPKGRKLECDYYGRCV
jgi:hypothetical protein